MSESSNLGKNKAFLGTGWGFPPLFERRSKRAYMVSSEEDIRQALHILFSTIPGERVMQPDFGCGLKSMVFESLTESTITEIKSLVERAILFHEPRIDLEMLDVNVTDELGGVIEIDLTYRVRETNSRSNMVYPFYFNEGTYLDLAL